VVDPFPACDSLYSRDPPPRSRKHRVPRPRQLLHEAAVPATHRAKPGERARAGQR
ncbi:hypothetical protein C8Q70DRAFT_954866, partial [Cubamyces menziesii]